MTGGQEVGKAISNRNNPKISFTRFKIIDWHSVFSKEVNFYRRIIELVLLQHLLEPSGSILSTFSTVYIFFFFFTLFIRSLPLSTIKHPWNRQKREKTTPTQRILLKVCTTRTKIFNIVNKIKMLQHLSRSRFSKTVHSFSFFLFANFSPATFNFFKRISSFNNNLSTLILICWASSVLCHISV